MASIMHKYYCDACNLYVFADSPEGLADRLNYHNHTQHPYLSDRWTPDLVVQSNHYEPAAGAPAYITPSPVGGNMKLKELTPEDRELLAGMLIKWD